MLRVRWVWMKTAAFFVATTFRPLLLRRSLQRLVEQKGVPSGWQVKIHVAGESGDPGRKVVSDVAGATYHEVGSRSVTDKLNSLLVSTRSDLVMLADDDDIQSWDRAAEAIKAYEDGAEWSCSGTCLYYDLNHDLLTRWTGVSVEGLIGTMASFATPLLQSIRGWPPVSRGKDGRLVARIRSLRRPVKFADLTAALGNKTICLQHDKNLWNRPLVQNGATDRRGRHAILGLGGVRDNVPLLGTETADFLTNIAREFDQRRIAANPPPSAPVPPAPPPPLSPRLAAYLPKPPPTLPETSAQEPVVNLTTPSVLKESSPSVSCDVHVIITTFNRPDLLVSLLGDLIRERGGRKIHVVIYDDGSTKGYDEVKSIALSEGWIFRRYEVNQGKKGYHRIVSAALQEASSSLTDRFLFLQDDVRLCREFFDQVLGLWDQILDPDKATLYLFRDSRRSEVGTICWTGFRSRIEGPVERTQWTDCVAFLFDRSLLVALDNGLHPIPESRWVQEPLLSSGVGQQISVRLNRAKKGLYRTLYSYVSHSEGPSVMNPRARRIAPMITTSFVDKIPEKNVPEITASLATIPSRRASLEKVVRCLLPQVDRLNVYLNETPAIPGSEEYLEIPDFLNDPKIVAVRSQDTAFGDRGDAGKFYWAGDVQGYHVICDDDLHYPRDFVQTLIEGVEKYGRKAVVGFHGAVLTDPFTEYYRSRRVYHFSRSLGSDIPVHILASNSLAYHTDTISVSQDDFRSPNMADIWFGLKAQQDQVPMLCLSHPEGWLVDDPLTREDSIYSHSTRKQQSRKNTADLQTKVVKESWPWELSLVGRPPSALETIRKAGCWTSEKPEVPSCDHGWLAEGTARMLDLNLNDQTGLVLELGAWLGKSTRHILSRAPNAVVISVDSWDEIAIRGWIRSRHPHLLPIVEAGVRNTYLVNCWDYKERLIPLHMKSLEALRFLRDRGAVPDVIFLDTSHSYEDTLAEVLAIASTFPSAVLVGDDWEWRDVKAQDSAKKTGFSQPVARAVEEFIRSDPRWSLQVDGNGWVIRRLPPSVLKVKGPSRMGWVSVEPGDHLHNIIRQGSYYETDLLLAIRELQVRGLYVDVGANVGNHTAFFCNECPSTGVLAIEPDPENLVHLRETVRLNSLGSAVDVRSVAIHPTLSHVSLSQGIPKNKGTMRVTGKGEIEATTLDRLLESLSPSLIKIDVEGMPLEVVRTGEEVIDRCRPVIVCEANDQEAAALDDFLGGYGYRRQSRRYCRTATWIWTVDAQAS